MLKKFAIKESKKEETRQVEISIERNGIKNSDEAVALIYYGRYEVNSWSELYYAAVKTLYIEYPEVINSLISKDENRDLYLRTTTIGMKEPARLGTILYLDVARTPEQIVRGIREIFKRAGVLNIKMSIEIRQQTKVNALPPIQMDINPVPQVVKKAEITLDVPKFMKSERIKKAGIREKYIDKMTEFAKKYPQKLKNLAGKYINKRRVTMAETGYRYFKEEIEIGNGLSIELDFTEEELNENLNYYNNFINNY